ncbi:MAG TPA: CHRD domain-containing protein [Rhodocyclaceae bacterium]|nr:CHRD domain-containing protein [Rhodocyclaceae bacterium]
MKIQSMSRQAVLFVILAVAAAAAAADEVKLKLTGAQEVPPVATKAEGMADFMVNPDMTVTGKVTTTGVAGTMAHIHTGKAGTNGPVSIGLIRGAEGEWLVPPGAKLDAAQYSAYKAGDLYVNVHSAEHKGGEIRAQLPAPMAGTAHTPGY